MRGIKADDSLLHEQERDVSKKWVRSLIQQVTKKLFFESNPEMIANGFAEDVDYIKRIIKAINSAGLGSTADEVYNKLHEED